MRTTLESISDGVLAIDGSGRIALANRAAQAMLGLDEDLEGRPLDALLPALAEVEATDAAPVVVAYVASGGGQSALEATIAPLGGAGENGRGRVIALRDITDRRRLEEELARGQRLESLGVLAGGIAHDFNNLLTVILGHASLLENAEGLPAEERGTVARIRLSSEKARALTQQLLTFARGGEPRRERTLLGPLLEDTQALALSGSAVDCRRDLDQDLWPALVDPDQVGQVLSNLLINARQAMPDGGTVTVSARNLTAAPEPLPEGSYLEIVVADEGPGLAPAVREHLFEPFFTTKADGNGLGLAVAYSVVRRHGGLLTADEAPGGGAAFTMVLPAQPGPVAVARHPDAAAAPCRAHILVMDDEPAVRDIVARMLGNLGAAVEAAADGAEALALWEEARRAGRPFDLAILDLTVPGGMGGLETLRRLQADEPGARALVASGYSNDAVLADPVAHGFAGSIVKPFDRATLAGAVHALLDDAPSP
jgi:PAS domain S-box-containing protein